MNSHRRALRAVPGLLIVSCLVIGSAAVYATDDEKVVFNTQSHKFHCSTCKYAVKCTKNCVTVTKSEAIKRGGVPCKVCGGTCKKKASASVRSLSGAEGVSPGQLSIESPISQPS